MDAAQDRIGHICFIKKNKEYYPESYHRCPPRPGHQATGIFFKNMLRSIIARVPAVRPYGCCTIRTYRRRYGRTGSCTCTNFIPGTWVLGPCIIIRGTMLRMQPPWHAAQAWPYGGMVPPTYILKRHAYRSAPAAVIGSAHWVAVAVRQLGQFVAH
eukprot:SAG31_NODE_10383_length_1145_cov_1.398662_2_plen_156_part_00